MKNAIIIFNVIIPNIYRYDCRGQQLNRRTAILFEHNKKEEPHKIMKEC